MATSRIARWIRKRVSGLPLRLFFFVAIPLVTLQLVAAWSVLNFLEEKIEGRMQEDVELIARALQRPIGSALVEGNSRQVLSILNASFDFRRVYSATIYDQGGDVIATSGETDFARRLPKHALPSKGGGTYEKVHDKEVYSYYVPIWLDAAGRAGMLRVTRKRSEIDEFLGVIRTATAGIVVAGSLLTAFILFWGHYVALGKGLGELETSIHRIEKGDRKHRASPSGPREVREIVGSFNGMMDAIDHTERVLSREREKKESLMKHVFRMEKMASIGRIAGGIAHELGSPLGTFAGRLERMLRLEELPPRARMEVLKLNGEVEHMTRIVSEVLDFARTDHRARCAVNMRNVLRSALSTLGDSPDVRSPISVDFPDQDLWVFADATRLERAVSNLARNALAAIGKDGHVQILLENMGDEKLRLSVCDNGRGVPEEIVDTLFEPFVTTRHGKGTGLGLPIAQAVVRQHGGEIVYEARADGGSRFYFELPLLVKRVEARDAQETV